jgi:outer membrane receptor for monomeric catechols
LCFAATAASAQPTPQPAEPAASAPAPEDKAQTITVTGNRDTRSYQTLRAGTATKTDTPLIDTPQAITVIPRDVLEDQGARQVADAMRNVSGVSREASYWGQEGNSFRTRGFALSDEHGHYKDARGPSNSRLPHGSTRCCRCSMR